LSDKDILSDALEAFELAAERENDNRVQGLEDLRFARLAEQWYEADKTQRASEGRPCLTINRLPSFIRQVVNDARQNSPSIIVHPVDSKADPETAEIINGLIRNIEASSDAEVAYDTALEYAVTSSFGYFRINVAYADDDTFDQDICIRRIANPFSVYGDPYSTAHDSSDWNTAFVVDQLPKTAFEKKYKGADKIDWAGSGYGQLKDPWLTGEEVQVAEYWCRDESSRQIVALDDGNVLDLKEYQSNKDYFDHFNIAVVGSPRAVKSHKVTQYIMSGAEVLDTVEWAGKYIPIIPVYGEEINVEGKRHLRSMVRDAKDPQRMFNYWRTAATELVALAPKAPWIGEAGSFTDPKWETANTQSYSFIEYAKGRPKPERQPFSGVPAGALQEALNASDDMKAIMGLFDASLGAKSNETSGRAILARQREGDVSSFHFIDNLSRSIRHAGRVIIDLIPHVYTTARMQRVLGADSEAQSVPINQPVIVQPPQPGQPAQAPQPIPQGTPVDDKGMPIDPQLKAMARIFDLTVGKYDVTVETGPSFNTQREEAANQMMELLRVYPQAAPVIGDILAENLDWPGAEEIADRLKQLMQHMLGAAQQQGQGQGGAADPKLMQELQALQTELMTTKQQLAALQADQSTENDANQIKAFDATTKRLKVVSDASKPSHLPQQPK
jgi:hypothetical protein